MRHPRARIRPSHAPEQQHVEGREAVILVVVSEHHPQGKEPPVAEGERTAAPLAEALVLIRREHQQPADLISYLAGFGVPRSAVSGERDPGLPSSPSIPINSTLAGYKGRWARGRS